MWARVDDGWWCHPKVMGLGLAARGLWVSALSWSCHQRKPHVPWTLLVMVGADEAHAAELVAAGLWSADGEGWLIHDWAEYQEMTTKEKRAEAGRKGGQRSGESRRSKAKQTDALTSGNVEASGSNGEANAEAGPSRPFPSQPKALRAGPLARPRLPEFTPPPPVTPTPPPPGLRTHLRSVASEATA